jgi:DMSO reductase family type II enzyme chaperone
MNGFENKTVHVVRASAYKLFAECYYPPDEHTLAQAERLCREAGAVCPATAEALDLMAAGLAAASGIEELAVDHARLFVGPFALLAPPYGSVYLDGERRLMGDSALDVSECYREVGLEAAAGFSGTPDHVAAELEFMHFLAVKEIEARAGVDVVRAGHLKRKQRAFLERHLAVWAPDFTGSVEAQAQTLFYRGLAVATRTFVENDFKRLAAED